MFLSFLLLLCMLVVLLSPLTDHKPSLPFIVFQDLKTGKKIGGGSERNDLWYFDMDFSRNVALQSSTSSFQDHGRVGHLSLSSLKKLVASSQSLSTFPCEACELSKHCHTSFYLRVESLVSRLF